MIHGTKLLDTDMELFAAALTQTEVLVWSLNENDVFVQIDSGILAAFSANWVKIKSSPGKAGFSAYLRESCELSVKICD